MKILPEIIKVALGSLYANKLKSFLTILGIVVGIFSIISISTVIEMLQKSIEEGVSGMGQNTFYINKWPAVITSRSEWLKYRNRKNVSYNNYEKLKKVFNANVSIGAEQSGNDVIVKYNGEETNPNVDFIGLTPEAFSNRDLHAASGRNISQKDLESSADVVVLGADIVKKIFKRINPVGQHVKIDGRKLRVIGVLEKRGEIFGQSQDNFAIVPLTSFQSFYGKRYSSIRISIKVFDTGEYNELMEKATGYFRTIRKVPIGMEDDFSITTNEAVMKRINDMTSGVRIGSIVIAMIALLAAGIGIMNIMLVSVTERTREIGIRKSIGAKKNNILFQFIVEAVVLCQIGGIIGIAFGVLLGNAAGTALKANAMIPYNWIFIGVILCTAVGVGFGVYPAYKAANLDPIEALRYE